MTGAMSTTDAELLRLADVHFRRGTRAVLRGVDLCLHAGERVALVGPNGAGKTTLLHLLVGPGAPGSRRRDRLRQDLPG